MVTAAANSAWTTGFSTMLIFSPAMLFEPGLELGALQGFAHRIEKVGISTTMRAAAQRMERVQEVAEVAAQRGKEVSDVIHC